MVPLEPTCLVGRCIWPIILYYYSCGPCTTLVNVYEASLEDMKLFVPMAVFLSVIQLKLIVVNAQNLGSLSNSSNGCHLLLYGYDNIEPEGDPLLLHVRIRVRRLQDIPISGGSFSVGIM